MAVKQVIVVRKDLNMRKGKIAAQVAHAAIGIFFDRMEKRTWLSGDIRPGQTEYRLWINDAMSEWVDGAFTKVVLGCTSEEELLAIMHNATVAKLPTKLITDAGRTEFHGIPTNTCVAIGPADEKDIDAITGHLKLI